MEKKNVAIKALVSNNYQMMNSPKKRIRCLTSRLDCKLKQKLYFTNNQSGLWLVVLMVCICGATSTCPEGYEEVRGYCLHFSRNQSNWFSALRQCIQRKGFLVSINTADKMLAISEYLYQQKFVWNAYWTSASDLEVEGSWMWYGTGDPVNFTHWCSGQPDNFDKEHCAHIHFSHRKRFCWNDLPCNWNSRAGRDIPGKYSVYYICESPRLGEFLPGSLTSRRLPHPKEKVPQVDENVIDTGSEGKRKDELESSKDKRKGKSGSGYHYKTKVKNKLQGKSEGKKKNNKKKISGSGYETGTDSSKRRIDGKKIKKKYRSGLYYETKLKPKRTDKKTKYGSGSYHGLKVKDKSRHKSEDRKEMEIPGSARSKDKSRSKDKKVKKTGSGSRHKHHHHHHHHHFYDLDGRGIDKLWPNEDRKKKTGNETPYYQKLEQKAVELHLNDGKSKKCDDDDTDENTSDI